ncbi:MAG: hypothetical protein LC624_01615, partial [Halobacteriales archaeon]|nr:hypothetical protein [Halobacteriales archaeon]
MRATPLLLALLLALPAAAAGSALLPRAGPGDAWNLAGQAVQRMEATQPRAAHELRDGLATAASVFAALDARPGLAGAAEVARLADARELARLGATMPGIAIPHHARASDAAAQLLAAHGLRADGLGSLDAAPPDVARVLDAFLAFEQATREAFAPLRLVPIHPGATLPDLGVDEPRILAARAALLDASVALAQAWHPRQGCDAVQVPPVLSIELAACDRVYADDFALTIDAGGDDLYLGNAGGNAIADPGCAGLSTGGASALLDLSGDDRYLTDRGCGVHGGARLGAGFLLDVEGNDTYSAACCDLIAGGPQPGHDDPCPAFISDCCASDYPPFAVTLFPDYWYPDAAGGGTNGGAQTGLGFLLDAAGDDAYRGGDRGTNGGGATVGVGELLDLAGDDRYEAGDLGTNGGAWWGHAFFLDAGGDDTYLAGSNATNGGTYDSSAEFLDGGGNDVFRAGSEGVNGGSWGGTSLLVARDGDDVYEGERFGVNGGMY